MKPPRSASTMATMAMMTKSASIPTRYCRHECAVPRLTGGISRV
jgi:hypothetical protein